MPAGTITLTNNSTAVTGSGTAFATELKANDFLVAVVGGTTYTLGVKSVESATALTLTTAYGGPTTGGLAWTPIPNGTLVGITAQIAADTARAIRGLNYDKQNWQQVYSASGNITVTLPDGSTYTGPSWNGITTALTGKADKMSLGSAASKNVGLSAGNVMSVGSFGLGGQAVLLNNADIANPVTGSQLFMYGGGPSGYWTQWGAGVKLNYGGSHNFHIYLSGYDATLLTLVHNFSAGAPPVIRKHYNDGNTVVDSNGFLKRASPVVKLFHDGDYATNDESEGIVVTRLSAGEYLIENCMGLNSDAAWGGVDGGFEIPVDRNKQPRIWLDYEIKPDGSILVKTFHRTYPDAPEFAQNKVGHKNDDGSFTETVMNGAPIDIPADQFVSVRVEMPEGSIYNQKKLTAKKARNEAE